MLKDKKKIYDLGGLTDLFMERIRPAVNNINNKDFTVILEKYLLREKVENHDTLFNSVSEYWWKNYKCYTDIIDSFERIYQVFAYLCKFPKYRYYNFYHINELTWLRYHIEFYLQENYILRERTCGWIDYLKDIAKHKSDENSEKTLIKIKNIFIKLFESISRVRGSHVHVSQFEPRDLGVGETLNFLIRTGITKSLTPLRNINLIKIKSEWKENITKNTKIQIKIYNKLFSYLKNILLSLE